MSHGNWLVWVFSTTVIIQWGIFAMDTSAKVYFPTSYTNYPHILCGRCVASGPQAYATRADLTFFTVVTNSAANSSLFIAIGY